MHGVIHYAVGNMPGAVPYTSTYALTNATLPYVLDVAVDGPLAAIDDPALAHGLNTARGHVTNAAVAESLSLPYVEPRTALSRGGPPMKLGYSTGYWGSGPPAGALESIKEAERLGFDSVWTAEAYGSDALTPARLVGRAHDRRFKLGTGIVQMSARTPAATAMAAMTLDHLSRGRVILGLGASGPQVVEGWYGQPYPKPLARTREYVDIVRPIVARDEAGRVPRRALRDARSAAAPVSASRSSRPSTRYRTDIPIYLGAEGPKNVALAAEICDGWLPLFFSPKADRVLPAVASRRGSRDRRAGAPPTTSRWRATMSIIPGDDVEKCADVVRPMLALYAGGMGARGANFHFDVFARHGLRSRVPPRSRSCTSRGRRQRRSPPSRSRWSRTSRSSVRIDKIRGELPRWKETCLTTMLVSAPAPMLGAMADLLID